eukprot:scaffold372681_cov18-Prasinocladus_malaysianus.AAC.1
MTRLDSKLMYAAAKVRPHPRLAPTLVQRVHRRQQGDWGGKRWKAYPVMDDWPHSDASNSLTKECRTTSSNKNDKTNRSRVDCTP